MKKLNDQNSHGNYLAPGQSYGQVVSKRLCSDLVLCEIKHDYGRKLPQHSHELAIFSLILDGTYTEKFGSRTVSYNPFSIYFHPPEFTHRDEIGISGCKIFNIEVQNQWIERLREYSLVPDSSTDLQGGELVWLATRLYREYREMDACSPLLIEGLTLEMLALTARGRLIHEKQPPAWLSKVVDLLNSEFNHNLTINQIAAEMGVHPFHLSKTFRKFYNQSVGEYIHRLQVQFACSELSQSEKDLADIACQAGFADQSHFTRIFKRITGLTPGAFRNSMGSEQ
jgi:AraC family transcriptional regulator